MRSQTSFLKKAAATLVVCVVTVPAVAVAATATMPKEAIQAGDGPRVTTSRDGSAIVTAGGLAPGERTHGTVDVTNDGDATGRLELRAPTVSDDPGRFGGALSKRLILVVTDITSPGESPVYSGPPRGLGPEALGRLDAGQTRSFRFQLRFPDGAGPSLKPYQASSVEIDFAWTIRA